MIRRARPLPLLPPEACLHSTSKIQDSKSHLPLPPFTFHCSGVSVTVALHLLPSVTLPRLNFSSLTPDSHLNILTVQSSKGIEFRSVIFIGLGQIDASETQAARNMKFLYVGMTRAKERLMITASGRHEITERLESMTDPVSAVA